MPLFALIRALNTCRVRITFNSVLLTLVSVIAVQTAVFSQRNRPQKVLSAYRPDDALKIDGVLDEPAWLRADIATDFIQNDPRPGELPSQRTEVRVLYDDDAIYIGAMMYDSAPDSILNQLTDRDELGNADFFDVYISCFRDGINAFRFTVTPSGVQYDAQITAFGEDLFWNGVWQCNTSVNDAGWVAEFKIPYSALRFPEESEQLWDVNFARSIRRLRELSYWNEVDPEIPGIVNQSGLLRNIKNISPPVRLFFYPYAVAYGEVNTNNSGNIIPGGQLTGGMDVKYGINDAFTLDMALIPDFGQVRSDNVVLNLSPFEVFFEEQRQFFTEGVELFNKGGLFYSRRVGGTPINRSRAFSELNDGDRIVNNPFESQLLNATKISGRNRDGLGFGFFNAITAPTYATIADSEGNQRDVQTAPLSNYNILVADQNLGKNSYVTLVNSNVMRDGGTYDANVIGAEFDLRDDDNAVSLTGGGAYSHKFAEDLTEGHNGYRYNIGLNKINGKWNYGIDHSVMTRDYDHNDLGFLRNANYVSTEANLTYRVFKPFWVFNRVRSTLSVNYDKLFVPNAFVNTGIYSYTIATTKSFDTFVIDLGVEPQGMFDYFEPRSEGRFFHFPASHMVGGWFSSDYRRVIALDASIYNTAYDGTDWNRFYWRVGPRIRFSDRFMFVYSYTRDNFNNQQGFTDIADNGEVVFGERDVIVHTNLFTINYIFTNRMGFTFRLRHYWSTVDYSRYALLTKDGKLGETIASWVDRSGREQGIIDGVNTRNQSYNAFNIDAWFTWVFSPGSEMRIVWKNMIEDNDVMIPANFNENFTRTMGLAQTNSISIRLLYFIDYLNFVRSGKFIEN